MGTIAIYQVRASRDRGQEIVKLALKALGLTSEDSEEIVTQGVIQYPQRDYADFASILGGVTLYLTIGRLKEGVAKEFSQPVEGGVQAQAQDASDSTGEEKEG